MEKGQKILFPQLFCWDKSRTFYSCGATRLDVSRPLYTHFHALTIGNEVSAPSHLLNSARPPMPIQRILPYCIPSNSSSL